ncbi:inhibitor of apoptosis protein [Penaeus vannamei nudivirus]|nr:inhibitor of apoptosis protein [Penaeus vannamei nucleopolyhedrovirus]
MASYKRFDSIHDMKREAMRLTTFKNKWNCKVPEPADIAYAGLYSARHLENNEPLDHTICAFCNGIIGYWETNDVPITEHKRHFPDCPYMRGSPVGNIPVRYEAIIERVLKYIDSEQQQTPNTRPRPESVDTTGLGTINTLEYSSLMMEAGVSEREMPKYPTFKTLDSRHKSFYPVYLSNPSVVRVWPSSARMGNALADAGFFYCGVTDHVRCFQCGGGLRNLEETDDFWALHATFYPKCQYLYLVKGSQYIENVSIIKVL